MQYFLLFSPKISRFVIAEVGATSTRCWHGDLRWPMMANVNMQCELSFYLWLQAHAHSSDPGRAQDSQWSDQTPQLQIAARCNRYLQLKRTDFNIARVFQTSRGMGKIRQKFAPGIVLAKPLHQKQIEDEANCRVKPGWTFGIFLLTGKSKWT